MANVLLYEHSLVQMLFVELDVVQIDQDVMFELLSVSYEKQKLVVFDLLIHQCLSCWVLDASVWPMKVLRLVWIVVAKEDESESEEVGLVMIPLRL